MRSVESTILVGTASQQLLPANPSRVGLLLANNGVSDVYLSFNGAAVAGSGIPLWRTERPTHLSLATHGDQIGQPVFAISVSAVSPVLVIETFL